jgi:cytochrome c peroxidase
MTLSPLLRRVLAGCALVSLPVPLLAQLPPPPAPPENPITPEKAVLGKILFWDEQLSSDNTVACGTCHVPAAGGADARTGTLASRNPGPDGVGGTPDDVFGAIGVMRADAQDDYVLSALFGFQPQVTGRQAPSFAGAQYFNEVFWDGRARSSFTDPETGLVSIAAGGALESQVVGPPVSDVEMAHEARGWSEITAKLATVQPLKLAASLTPDVVTALNQHPTYPALFASAFGTEDITAGRIAFAIATYERTLVPDRTPFDLGTLTPGQQQGFGAFNASNCAVCHTPPLFSNGTFRNVGLRPPGEDLGRQVVTGNPADRGRFKVPSLRNVGLRSRFFHTGNVPPAMGAPANTLEAVVAFYARGGDFPDNRDPLLATTGVPLQARPALIDFLRNGLTDPRVANEEFPFDRPELHSESAAPNPLVFGAGVAGSGGVVPEILALSPPSVDTPGFKIGVASGLGGAVAHLVLVPATTTAGGRRLPSLRPSLVFDLGSIVLEGAGAGGGFGTLHLELGDVPLRLGPQVDLQWVVADPAAPGGVARSAFARLTLF